MANDGIHTLYGQMSAPDWPDDLIVRALREHGEWGETETDILASMIQKQDRIWDVGAFLGTFSLSLGLKSDFRSIVAVEASPTVAPHLAKNLETNLEKPFQVVEGGVAIRSGWLTPVQTGHENNHGSQEWSWNADDASAEGGVPARSLRELRAEHDDYDVLKLDLEGMELDALQSDQNFIKTTKPLLWMECNEAQSSIDVLGMLKWLGYEIAYLAFPAFRCRNFLAAEDLIFPGVYEAALLAGSADRMSALTLPSTENGIIFREIQWPYQLRRALFDTPRWCSPEWAKMTKAELIAQLVRLQSKQTVKDFF